MGPKIPPSLVAFPMVGVDGGAKYADRLDIWVGDSDSHEGDIKALHAFHHPEDKDISDLGLAFSLFSRPLPYHLHMWGFLGGRKDHELFNLGEGLNFLAQHSSSQVSFYDSNHKLSFKLVSKGQWTFELQGLFSIGCLRPVNVTLTGSCKYPIREKREIPPLSSLGLSNFGKGSVVLDTDGPLFIYFPESK